MMWMMHEAKLWFTIKEVNKFWFDYLYHLKHATRKHAHFQKCDIDYQMACEKLS
jgi:hypothetical protein